jgi:hypothetical protein
MGWTGHGADPQLPPGRAVSASGMGGSSPVCLSRAIPTTSRTCTCLVSAEADLGRQVLRAGDSFFVPADAPYKFEPGPDGVEILEIRH